MCFVCVTTVCAFSGCGNQASDSAGKDGKSDANKTNVAQNNSVSNENLDAMIERLEKQAEKSPGVDTVNEALANAYVRRGNARRTAGELKDALQDYRRALIFDEDNLEAQRSIAELSLQVEGERTGEYGEPEPPPISPGVTAQDEEAASTPKPSPTAKKRP